MGVVLVLMVMDVVIMVLVLMFEVVLVVIVVMVTCWWYGIRKNGEGNAMTHLHVQTVMLPCCHLSLWASAVVTVGGQ